MTPAVAEPALEAAFEALTDGLRVLVVEDDEDQQFLVQQFFRGTFATVFCEKDAKDAMDRIQSENFDFFILDVMLPGEDGWELFSRIRDLPEHRKTPALFLTCVIPHSEEALASDVHGHCRTLAKPCSKKSFRKAVVELLQN